MNTVDTRAKYEPVDLRILFGPLFGVDITLPESETFFCVGAILADNLQNSELHGRTAEHVLSRAINTLYIPSQIDPINFRLRLARKIPDIDKKSITVDYEVDFVCADGSETRSGSFNSVFRFGDIAFALKHRDEEWSRLVTAYVPVHALETTRPLTTQAGTSPTTRTRRGTRRLAAKIGIALVTSGGLAGLAYWQIERHLGTQRVANVDNAQARGQRDNAILARADGGIHVLAASRDGAGWDRQALSKVALPAPVQVAAVMAERQRLERVLDTAGIDFITVRLDTPARPVLVLNGAPSRLADDIAVRALRLAAPYAREVEVISSDLRNVEQQARNALNRAGVRYRRLAQSNGATFEGAGALGDEDLATLRNLIASFSREWGTRRIDFKVSLRTDWLKGKPYWQGNNGYVLIDHASWYFPPSYIQGANQWLPP